MEETGPTTSAVIRRRILRGQLNALGRSHWHLMITDLVSFDVTGLVPQPASPPERRWTGERGLAVLLTVGEATPVFPATAAGQSAMRTETRLLCAEAGAGLVDLTYHIVDGCQTKRTIMQFVIDPANGRRRRFLGVLQIATMDSCVVLKAECSETGVTGVRDTTVFMRLMKGGELTFDPPPPSDPGPTMLRYADVKGWLLDPNDPTPGHLARCVADDERFDADFPHHPLSLVRACLDRAQGSMSLAPELKLGRADSGELRTEPWWRIW